MFKLGDTVKFKEGNESGFTGEYMFVGYLSKNKNICNIKCPHCNFEFTMMTKYLEGVK